MDKGIKIETEINIDYKCPLRLCPRWVFFSFILFLQCYTNRIVVVKPPCHLQSKPSLAVVCSPFHAMLHLICSCSV